MAQRKVRSVNKKLTEEERGRHQVIRDQIGEEKADLIARGQRVKVRHAILRQAIAALKAAREALGLSLAEMTAYTGIDKENLSRLENDPNPNPAIDTLYRYADAVGKEIVITLVERSNANGR